MSHNLPLIAKFKAETISFTVLNFKRMPWISASEVMDFYDLKHHLLNEIPTTERSFQNDMWFVRRQGFWHQSRLKLRESSAHLVGCIMQRVVCDASVAFRMFYV